MLAHAKQSLVKIPSINRNIVVYEYGQSDKKVLLIHGWSGRGTQLFKIADELIKTDTALLVLMHHLMENQKVKEL